MRITKISKITSIAIMLAITGGLMMGCDGDAKHKDKKTNTSYLYQYTANCSGGDTASGHSNKIVLTKATSQAATVSVSDFYIHIDYAGDYKVSTTSSATWSGSPTKGGNTSVTGLKWSIGSSSSALSGTIHWDSLDLDGDSKAEGNATFTF